MDFILRSKTIHGDKYDYSFVEYKNNTTKVKIICPIHDLFEQTPANHLQGRGCSKCGLLRMASKRTLTNEEFIKKANSIHNNFYGYSNTNYLNSENSVIITCPIHGDITITCFNHLQGAGCSKCCGKYRKTNEEYIIEAKKIHNNYFDYSYTKFKNSFNKIIIVCPIHGKFKQDPANHLKGHGCPKCNESKGEKSINKFLKELNLEFEREYSFDDCLSVKKRKLRFDFYVSSLKLCIEYDGPQHYDNQVRWGHSSGYDKILENDTIKNKYCLYNNIKLIRIKYNVSKEKILNDLKNALLQEYPSIFEF